MHNTPLVIAAAIVTAGGIIAGAILVTGRYTASHHFFTPERQYVVGLDTWTGKPFLKWGARNPFIGAAERARKRATAPAAEAQ